MITFDELTKANSSIITLPITRKDKRGNIVKKEYAEVHQRVKVFRMLVPNGGIETEMVSLTDAMVVFRAVVKDETGNVLGTGTAYEERESSFINQTSYIENAETSAVGRALAMCGIGIDLSMASYEEVANAQLNQDTAKEAAATEEKIEELPSRDKMLEVALKHFPNGSKNQAMLLKNNGLEKLEEATDAQLLAIYSKFGGK